jgi:16S rRNA (uracil1498-N3)-methyltransferase
MRSKRLRRFYIEEINLDDKRCVITGSEAKQIIKVLRMTPGDRFILMDGKGSRFETLIESISSREVLVLLENRLPEPPPSPVKITLCQSLLKSRAMDYMIQKTSELGVDCLHPFYSDRTVISFEKDRLANKMRHWHEIGKNSAKQCGRRVPVKIEMPCSFKELTVKCHGERALKAILWEDERSKSFKTLLKSCSPLKHFVGIVGPEGGFTREEIKAAGEAGFEPSSLGDRILRAETAAITMVAVVQYELGDLSL